jgi:hypothetical protein
MSQLEILNPVAFFKFPVFRRLSIGEAVGGQRVDRGACRRGSTAGAPTIARHGFFLIRASLMDPAIADSRLRLGDAH